MSLSHSFADDLCAIQYPGLRGIRHIRGGGSSKGSSAVRNSSVNRVFIVGGLNECKWVVVTRIWDHDVVLACGDDASQLRLLKLESSQKQRTGPLQILPH